MKSFACGDIVPGCTARFTAADDEDLLRQVSAHAAADHGLAQLPPGLAQQILAAAH